MPTPAATAPPAAQHHAAAGGKNAPPPPEPFTRAADEHYEPCNMDTATLLDGTTHGPIPLDVPAAGYLRGVFVRATASGGAGAGVVAKADAPWSAIQQINLTDVSGSPLLDTITGYELYLINKYGGYFFYPDPTLSGALSAIAATGGGFEFILYLPVEVSAREGLGALPNMNAKQIFRSKIRQAASTDIYSTPPSTLPSLRFRATMAGWTAPQSGETPPGEGTVQQWSAQQYTTAGGAQKIQLERVGNNIRNLILEMRDPSGVRNDSLLPDDLSVKLDYRMENLTPRIIRRHLMSQRYGFAANGYDAGIDVIDFTHDFDGHPGGEMRDLWLPTTPASRYELSGTWGAGVLTVLTNEVVVPAAGIA